MLTRRNKIQILIGVFLFILLLMVFFLFPQENRELVKGLFMGKYSEEELRDRLLDTGFWGYGSVAILSMLQVICTFIPAEPIQVLAGLAFGFPVGLACCVTGVLVGNTLIYMLYRCFGSRLQRFFRKNLSFDLEALAGSSRIVAVILLLYFLPAIPYGMICFFAAGVGMRYHRYILVTLLGSIPSVCIGVALGHMTLSASWVLSVCVFLVLIGVVLLMTLKKDWLFAKINAFASKPPYSSKTAVQPVKKLVLYPLYFAVRFYYALKGIRIKATDKTDGEWKGPAIVLVNHGSFIDFLYAEKLLFRVRPNFVVARLYFYHKILGTLLRYLGCFPKSMFALDLESTKNCLKVLKTGGVLAMMPEARLSTAGQFEDIQEGTYPFLKKAAVPVYTVKLSGDYLANPKWGKSPRRGALVEAELEQLFTAEEISSLSVKEIKEAVENRLYYDEFRWLESKPQLRYRNRDLAEGLENILTLCPRCGGKHSIQTKGRRILCDNCGELTIMDDRYGFSEGFPFRNLSQWYDWQGQGLAEQIQGDPAFSLSSPVTLRLSSTDGRSLTRPAGEGVCTLTAEGLCYKGTKDGENCEIHFPIEKIYRLLFGAGENFESYQGSEIYYFVPQERRSAVDWYQASLILYDRMTPSPR